MDEVKAVGVPEAARLIGLSESTMRRLIRLGHIASIKPAGTRRRLVSRTALDAFLQAYEQPTQPL
jgi:excisionase family DNA binding protein